MAPERSLGSPTLLLFPTTLELERFRDHGGAPLGSALLALCGFGPVAAAARTAQLLAALRPARVLLLGIAGTYDPDRLEVGEATQFSEVALHGVGVGEGEAFCGPPALGFPQWPGRAGLAPDAAEGAADSVGDRIVLTDRAEGLLLSTCAASDSPERARERRSFFPEAVAEDMEGFGVALACSLTRTPLRIVRGVSNVVGDRAPEHWRIPAALAAARRVALPLLEEPWTAGDGA